MKTLQYGNAVRRWISAGRPVRSDERVKEIFETCCKPCEHFDTQRETCRLCGCYLRMHRPAFLNKIKMATERCPLDPPKWIDQQ